MVAVFTGRTFAVHQIRPEIANTDGTVKLIGGLGDSGLSFACCA